MLKEMNYPSVSTHKRTGYIVTPLPESPATAWHLYQIVNFKTCRANMEENRPYGLPCNVSAMDYCASYTAGSLFSPALKIILNSLVVSGGGIIHQPQRKGRIFP